MKKLLAVALIALMALTAVFANGAKESAPAEKTNTLTVWAWDPNFNIPALLEAEKIYQETHPDFKLNIVENPSKDIEVKFVTADQAGDYSTLPDIFLMQDNSYQKFIANYPGIFTTLDNSGINFNDFAAGKSAMSTANGKHYGVPFDNGAVIMPIRTDIIAKAGYGEYFGHGLGHSVGLFIHEEPRLSMLCKETILPNMIQTVEPGIYVPGFGGVRIEDMVVVTEEGYRNLTHSPKDLIEL